MKRFLIIGLSFIVVQTFNGQEPYELPYTDGNSLARTIKVIHRMDTLDFSTAEGRDALTLQGYFAGFLDSSREWRRDSTIEIKFPPGLDYLTVGQLTAVVEKYLTEHPEELHLKGWLLVFLALKESFPNPDYRKPNHPAPLK
jgi:hypothetical protein